MQRRTPARATSPALELYDDDGTPRTGRIGNVLLESWCVWPCPARTRRSRELVRAAHGAARGKLGVLLRVTDGCGAPDPRALRSVSRFLHEIEDEVHGVAIVLEGGGFWASSMRAVFSSIVLMARSGPPTRVYGGLAEATEAIHDLLAQHGAAVVSEPALRAAAESLFAPASKAS